MTHLIERALARNRVRRVPLRAGSLLALLVLTSSACTGSCFGSSSDSSGCQPVKLDQCANDFDCGDEQICQIMLFSTQCVDAEICAKKSDCEDGETCVQRVTGGDTRGIKATCQPPQCTIFAPCESTSSVTSSSTGFTTSSASTTTSGTSVTGSSSSTGSGTGGAGGAGIGGAGGASNTATGGGFGGATASSGSGS